MTSKNPIKISEHLSAAREMLKKSKTSIALELKLKLADLILNLMLRRSGFGLFVILGWRDEWQEFTDISDSDQDIFDKKRENIMDVDGSSGYEHDIETTTDFDGAILINSNGDIMHSGVIIEGLRPKVVANEINPGIFADLSEQFDFERKVHTRHLSAIAASYVFESTTVFTVSEEADDFHIFEGGKITYSTGREAILAN